MLGWHYGKGLINYRPITYNNNNNKLYLHDHNKVLQYCKSYLKLLIESL